MKRIVKELPQDGAEELVEMEWTLAREGKSREEAEGTGGRYGREVRGMTCFLQEVGVHSSNNGCGRVVGRRKIRYETIDTLTNLPSGDKIIIKKQWRAGEW